MTLADKLEMYRARPAPAGRAPAATHAPLACLPATPCAAGGTSLRDSGRWCPALGRARRKPPWRWALLCLLCALLPRGCSPSSRSAAASLGDGLGSPAATWGGAADSGPGFQFAAGAATAATTAVSTAAALSRAAKARASRRRAAARAQRGTEDGARFCGFQPANGAAAEAVEAAAAASALTSALGGLSLQTASVPAWWPPVAHLFADPELSLATFRLMPAPEREAHFKGCLEQKASYDRFWARRSASAAAARAGAGAGAAGPAAADAPAPALSRPPPHTHPPAAQGTSRRQRQHARRADAAAAPAAATSSGNSRSEVVPLGPPQQSPAPPSGFTMAPSPPLICDPSSPAVDRKESAVEDDLSSEHSEEASDYWVDDGDYDDEYEYGYDGDDAGDPSAGYRSQG